MFCGVVTNQREKIKRDSFVITTTKNWKSLKNRKERITVEKLMIFLSFFSHTYTGKHKTSKNSDNNCGMLLLCEQKFFFTGSASALN
jgi:hypothetical protein